MPILESLYLSHTEEGRQQNRAHSSAKLETNLIDLRNKKWKTGNIIAIIKNSKKDTEVK